MRYRRGELYVTHSLTAYLLCGDLDAAFTNQPLDTLYSLRLDSGKQTIVTLIFLREAFGYGEPVFPRELLDQFLLEKLEARPAHTEK